MQCGPIRYRTDPHKAARERPFDHSVVIRETSFSHEMDDSTQIHDLYAALIADQVRNALIVKDVCAALRQGRSPVILTERRQHVETLRELLQERVRHLVVFTGGMGVKQRKAVADQLAAVPPGEERVILATGKYLGCDWIDVTAQGVPAHVGTPTPGLGYEDGDPFAEFLPPPVETDEKGDSPFMRAVVFVTEYSLKSTERNGQEYASPLLVLTGEEYAYITFEDLHTRLCNALRANRAPVVMEVLNPDGTHKVIRSRNTDGN